MPYVALQCSCHAIYGTTMLLLCPACQYQAPTVSYNVQHRLTVPCISLLCSAVSYSLQQCKCSVILWPTVSYKDIQLLTLPYGALDTLTQPYTHRHYTLHTPSQLYNPYTALHTLTLLYTPYAVLRFSIGKRFPALIIISYIYLRRYSLKAIFIVICDMLYIICYMWYVMWYDICYVTYNVKCLTQCTDASEYAQCLIDTISYYAQKIVPENIWVVNYVNWTLHMLSTTARLRVISHAGIVSYFDRSESQSQCHISITAPDIRVHACWGLLPFAFVGSASILTL